MFHKNKSSKDGLQVRCIECNKKLRKTPEARAQAKALRQRPKFKAKEAARQRAYHKTDKGWDVHFRSKLKCVYGITLEELIEIYENQIWKCVGCFEELKGPSNKDRKTSDHIDHDHKTNVVRGVLCRHCNIALNDEMTSEKLNRLASYLRRYGR